MSILVFIPAYNCENQIGRVLAQFTPDVQELFDGLIVVNNRSTDNTEQKASEEIQKLTKLDAKVLRNDENYGLGGSHKVAFEWAQANGYDHMVVLHGDDQGDIANLVPLLQKNAHQDLDCLLGARFHPRSQLTGYSAFRTFGNKVFNILFSIIAGKRLYDLGSGLNLYRTEILKDKFYQKFPDDLTFNYAAILSSCEKGHKFKFFPMEWREDDQISNVRLFSQAKRVLGMLGRFALNKAKFVEAEHRLNPKDAYTAQIIAENKVTNPQEKEPVAATPDA